MRAFQRSWKPPQCQCQTVVTSSVCTPIRTTSSQTRS